MEITIVRQTISLSKDETLIRKSKKKFRVAFNFDASWDGFTKTAIFQAGSVTQSVVLVGDVCDIPTECLENAGVYLKVLVHGAKDSVEQATPWCLTSRILYDTVIDIPVSPSPSPTPTPEGEVGRLCDEFATELETQYTEEDLKDKSLAEVIGDMDGLDNTASDAEVDDVINDVFG